MSNDFLKFANAQGLNSMHVEKVLSQSANNIIASGGYISPSILEERQLNVTQMDVFSRLRLGTAQLPPPRPGQEVPVTQGMYLGDARLPAAIPEA